MSQPKGSFMDQCTLGVCLKNLSSSYSHIKKKIWLVSEGKVVHVFFLQGLQSKQTGLWEVRGTQKDVSGKLG